MMRFRSRSAWCCFWVSFLPMIQAALGLPILFPWLQCNLRLLQLNFELSSFENYDEYFGDDTELILAQTGRYFGSDGIEEYIKFVAADFSRYIKESIALGQEVNFVEYDKKSDQCIFRLVTHVQNIMDSEYTISNAEYEYAAMLKLFLNYHEGFIDNVHVYFTDNLMDLYFNDFLNSDNTRNFVCGVRQGPCANYLTEAPPMDCFDALAALPSSTSEIYVDGNSQGCRALHASFAETNPAKHCAHISFSPQVDSDGQIKCQTSEGIQVSDLFSEKDLDAFADFCKKIGIDPAIGHTSIRTVVSNT